MMSGIVEMVGPGGRKMVPFADIPRMKIKGFKAITPKEADKPKKVKKSKKAKEE